MSNQLIIWAANIGLIRKRGVFVIETAEKGGGLRIKKSVRSLMAIR